MGESIPLPQPDLPGNGPGDGPWPLSGAITAWLIKREGYDITIVKNAFKELVLRGFWSIDHDADHLIVRPTRKKRDVNMRVPLLTIDQDLRHSAPNGGTVSEVLRGRKELGAAAIAEMKSEALRLGLVEMRKQTFLRIGVPIPYKTERGKAWAQAAKLRMKTAGDHPRQTDARHLGGLVVLLPERTRTQLGRDLRRVTDDDNALRSTLEWTDLDDYDESIEGLIDDLNHALGSHDHDTWGGGHDHW